MNERASYHWQPSLPYLSMNVVVIVEYNDDPSRDPSGTKASISNDDANPKEEKLLLSKRIQTIVQYN